MADAGSPATELTPLLVRPGTPGPFGTVDRSGTGASPSMSAYLCVGSWPGGSIGPPSAKAVVAGTAAPTSTSTAVARAVASAVGLMRWLHAAAGACRLRPWGAESGQRLG